MYNSQHVLPVPDSNFCFLFKYLSPVPDVRLCAVARLFFARSSESPSARYQLSARSDTGPSSVIAHFVVAPSYSLRYTRLAPHPHRGSTPYPLIHSSPDTRIPSSLRRLTEFAPPVYLAAPTLAVSASFPPRLTVPYLTSRLPFFVCSSFVRQRCVHFIIIDRARILHILPPPPPYLPRTLACYAITHYPSIVM